MNRPQRPSFPAPSEPNLRRLGVGSGGGNGRPLRAQLVVALVALLVLVAIPLYLWRRPGASEATPSASVSAALASAQPSSVAPLAAVDAGGAEERVRLGAPQRVRCGSSSRAARSREGPGCDQLGYFEEALKRAIRESVDCAPKARAEGSINFVLRVDFAAKRLHLFPGASGQWKGAQARRTTKCVMRNLPAPQWQSLQHQDNYYEIAIMATYPPLVGAAPAASGSAAPLFE